MHFSIGFKPPSTICKITVKKFSGNGLAAKDQEILDVC